MISLPILPGMRAISYHGIPCRAIGIAEKHGSPSPDGYYEHDIDYSDPATCGALMAWCHRELLELVIVDDGNISNLFAAGARRHLATVALNEARPWDAASIQRAVRLTREALDNS